MFLCLRCQQSFLDRSPLPRQTLTIAPASTCLIVFDGAYRLAIPQPADQIGGAIAIRPARRTAPLDPPWPRPTLAPTPADPAPPPAPDSGRNTQ
jgi:hypothetical protein